MKTVIGLIVLAGVTLSTADNRNCPVHLPRNSKLRHFGGSCYDFNEKTYSHKNWKDAANDCVQKRGHLVDIHSQAEQDFILSTWKDLRGTPILLGHGKRLWLGLNDISTEGKWSWFQGKTEIDFHNWAPFQPGNASNGKEEEHCGLMELSGEWYDYQCEDMNGWICEFGTVSNNDCPESLPKTYNLLQWRDHCYLFIIDYSSDWQSAELSCRLKEGHLVDIHSQDEQDFIFRTWAKFRFEASKEIGLWIGLTDGQDCYQEGQWNWTSNMKQLDYQNWYPGQPDNKGDREEDCALMTWADYGKWHDYPCNQGEELILHGWICKFCKLSNGFLSLNIPWLDM